MRRLTYVALVALLLIEFVVACDRDVPVGPAAKVPNEGWCHAMTVGNLTRPLFRGIFRQQGARVFPLPGGMEQTYAYMAQNDDGTGFFSVAADASTQQQFHGGGSTSIWTHDIKDGGGSVMATSAWFGPFLVSAGGAPERANILFRHNYTTTNGSWRTDDAPIVMGDGSGPYNIWIVFDATASDPFPAIYVNGAARSVSETTAPVGSALGPSTTLSFGSNLDSGLFWDVLLFKGTSVSSADILTYYLCGTVPGGATNRWLVDEADYGLGVTQSIVGGAGVGTATGNLTPTLGRYDWP